MTSDSSAGPGPDPVDSASSPRPGPHLDPELEAAKARLIDLCDTSLRAVIAKLEELDGEDCAILAHVLQRHYLEASHQLAAVRAEAVADALAASGISMLQLAARLGVHESRIRQLLAEHAGRKRRPQVKRRRPPDPTEAPGLVGRKRRATPLPPELRERLEEVSRRTGASTNSLILLWIAKGLDEMDGSVSGQPLPSE